MVHLKVFDLEKPEMSKALNTKAEKEPIFFFRF